jgi:two-component system, sensor histidine kinase and response regulator
MDKILIVEDDCEIRNNIEIFLKAEGFNVITSSNGLDAIRIIENNTPDLIISDIMMPYLDGIEFCKIVQNKFGSFNIPFVFLTAKSDLESIRKGLNLGADDYITKPFEFNDLLTAVKQRLSKKRFYSNQVEYLKTVITRNIPHEMRTPLVSIFGYTSYLNEDLETLSNEDIRYCLSAISKSSIRLYKRIEKFLNYINLESDLHSQNLPGQNDYSSFLIDGSGLTKMITENAVEYIRPDDLIIEVEKATLSISEEHLSIILCELTENAFQFSPAGTKVLVSGKSINDKYLITVSDSGRGFLPEEISSISSFRQFNRDLYQQNGLGLGLSLVNSLVKLDNGRFSVSSIPGKETKIEITLNTNKGVQNELV